MAYRIFAYVLLLLFAEQSAAQWSPLPGPNGNAIAHHHLLSRNDTLLAVAWKGGAYVSVNGGLWWDPVNVGFDTDPYWLEGWSAVEHEGRPYVSMYHPAGVYRSDRFGGRWERVSDAVCVRLFSVGGQLLCAQTGVLMRSSDAGQTWTESYRSPDTGDQFSDLIAHHGIWYLATYHGVLMSEDQGSTWTNLGDGLSRPIGSLVAFEDRIVAGATGSPSAFGQGVYLYSFSKKVWEGPVESSAIALAVAPLTAQVTGADTLLWANFQMNGPFGVFTSADRGETWTQVSGNERPYFTWALGGSLFANHSFLGLYNSPDRGLTWVPRNFGMSRVQVEELHLYADTLFAATWGSGVQVRANNELKWEERNAGLGVDSLYLAPDLKVVSLHRAGSYLFALTEYNGLFRSADQGRTWVQRMTGIARAEYGAAFPKLPALTSTTHEGTPYLYLLADQRGVYRSTDWGDTWVQLSRQGLWHPFLTSVLAFDNVVLVGNGMVLFRSTDLGATWSEVPEARATRMVRSGTDLISISEFFGNTLFRSRNGGETWQNLSEVHRDILPVGLHVHQGRTYAFGSRVWWTEDGGDTWLSDDTMFERPLRALAVSTTHVYAGDQTGIQVRPRGQIHTSTFTQPSLLGGMATYPNPASSHLTLSFALPTTEAIRVSVYDLLGRHIATLTDALHPAGTHTLNVDATSWPSGMYVVRLQTELRTETKRFSVVR